MLPETLSREYLLKNPESAVCINPKAGFITANVKTDYMERVAQSLQSLLRAS